MRGAALIVGAIVVFGFILLPVRSHGISMLPTYADGALNFANRAAYWWAEPTRGDVVAIRMAGPNVVYVKRIVGMPGERIEIVAGVVLINRKPLIEPHVRDKAPWNMPAET
jgi:signal peptidase I